MPDQTHLAFLILLPGPGSNSVSSHSSNGVTVTVAIVDSIDSARRLVRDLRSQGVSAIELSSSFDDEGLAAVREAAGDDVQVGRVRYGT